MKIFASLMMAISIALPMRVLSSNSSNSMHHWRTSGGAPSKMGQEVTRMPASSRTSEDWRRVRVARISQRAARERLREAVEKSWSRIKWTRLRRKQKTVDLLLSFAYFSSSGLFGRMRVRCKASRKAGKQASRHLLYEGVGEFRCGKLESRSKSRVEYSISLVIYINIIN